jgi:hypothetical protein
MAYYGQLKREGQATDVTLGEFADIFRKDRPYSRPECALWKDILYGSNRQQFWYSDPWIRFCLDMNQGGAMIDLRPYAAKLIRPCGVGTSLLQDASYPFLIQSNYRAGFFTHYAGEGAIKSCKFIYKDEEVDLCSCRTRASFTEDGDIRILILDPFEIEFSDVTIRVQSIFRIWEGRGEIEIVRKILDSSDPQAEIMVDEYITACYGTTEYPEDLTGITLRVEGTGGNHSLEYAYQCRQADITGVERVEAVIPQISTLLSMSTDMANAAGYYREGFAFSPMYTLGIRKAINGKGVVSTWLKVEKAD